MDSSTNRPASIQKFRSLFGEKIDAAPPASLPPTTTTATSTSLVSSSSKPGQDHMDSNQDHHSHQPSTYNPSQPVLEGVKEGWLTCKVAAIDGKVSFDGVSFLFRDINLWTNFAESNGSLLEVCLRCAEKPSHVHV